MQNGSYQNITSPSGYYSIANLSNGTYNFSYYKDGFRTGYFEFSFNGAVVINANKTIYDNTPLDSVSNPNMITGNFYINNTWTNPADADFNNTNFNYSNGTVAFVANSTTTFWNRTGLSPHEIQNISAQTVDIYGNINTTNVWFNVTIPNNVPDQTIIGNKTVTAGDLLIFNVSATDADNDTITYGTNATKGTLNTTTGNYTWQTNSSDVGIYVWYFNSSDNYGGTAPETINVTITEIPAFVPPIPVNLSSTQGNFWINHTWEPGAGNATDSYNISVNDLWTNSTSTYNNSTVEPHGWSNITVYAYNTLGTGTLNTTPVSNNTQVANNVPDQTAIGNKTVTAGGLLTFNVSATDADNDTITYGTNATYGTINATTGEYSWPTNSTDTGTYVWYFNSSDTYGGTSTETINVIVTEIPALVPPVPVNLTSTQGNFWINHTWEPGAGNVTDSYNISVNDIWTNGTTSTYNNSTVEPHGWSNITVYAYNSLGPGTLNTTPVLQDIQLANNIPVQTGIGDKTVTAGNLLTFNITATDADNDTITYGTNATNGSLNSTTGEYSWPTNVSDVGTYIWYFETNDTYGGSATETITITITEIPTYLPPDPVNLNSTRGSSWVNYTWEPGAGNVTDSYNVNVNGTWTNGTSNNYINTSIGPHGWSNITVYAYNASGSGTLSLNPVSGETQVLNTAPVQTPIGDKAVTAGMELTFSIISTDADSDPLTYSTNATSGTLNTTTGTYSWPTNVSDVGTYVWYFETNDTYGGSATETITITVTEIPTYLPPAPVNLNSTRGSSWVNYTWEPGAGNVTDSYNVNVNGTWINGTTSNYINTSIGPHGWSNITVYAYNASGSGTPSLNPVSGETQVLNAAPVQTPIGDKAVTAGDLLTFNIIATDADSDPLIYSTNATSGTLNTTTGEYSWLTNGTDTGTYVWYFNSSDNYGGTATETITITVTEIPTYLPPAPVNLNSTRGSSWVNYTWEPGAGNVTDSYNVNVNGTWTNGTTSTYNNITVGPHGWSNITVYAYNASGSGTLSLTPVSGETQVLNADPVQSPIGDKAVTAGMELTFSIISTDADSDPLTYSTNATSGTLNTTTGTYSWPTNVSDVGTYVWFFNSTDNYGSTATETITITVTEIPTYLPPDPVNLNSTLSSSWVNYTWEPGAGNVTDSYNVNVNGTWTNGTTSNYINTSIVPHGWSNITVYAYNASGSGTLSLNPVSGETQVLNTAPVQTPIGDKAVTAGMELTFSIISTDADSDPLTYGTNATRGTLNTTTGTYSWPTNASDVGTYVWYFETNDTYGGSATETITITITEIPTYLPPDPVNLNSTRGSSWVNYTWEPGAGNVTDSYNVNVNGTWTNGTSNNYINTSIGPHGWSNITVYAYNASGSGTLSLNPVSDETQVLNTAPVQTPIGDKAVTAGMELTFSIISTDADSDPLTYSTNATSGTLNTTTGTYSWPTSVSDVGTYVWYFETNDTYGGSATETITITVTEIPTYLPPAPVNLNSTLSSSWVNYTWEPGAGNVTDSYNVNVNGTWTNGTTNNYINTSIGPHGWSNITVYAYNASGSGTLSLNPVSDETQVLNTAPVQTPIGDKAVTAGMELTFSIISMDADSDPLTYGTNATRGTLNITTGTYSWPTNVSDVGTYVWYFETNDTYGGSATETITITVTEIPTYLPPDPVNLNSTRGSSWVNYTWEPGAGNVTDSYNVNVNGTWTNGTTSNYINTSVSPHGWSNITVYAYNASGSGTPSLNPVSDETQVLNAAPVQTPIGDKAVTAGDLLTFNIIATDADSDPLIYSTNATNGTLNTTTGEYSWLTNGTDTGTYVWYFNSSDNYGGTATETITITVTEIPTYLPPAPVNLNSTRGSSWVNYTWEPGAGNVTDSYNVNVNGTWTNGTSNNYINTSIGPHGWSNITVYAYNASGSGTLSLTPVSGETQVLNAAPLQAPIGDKAVTAGDLLTFNIIATDADSDPLIYSTNATNGTLNTTTGEYSWLTNGTDTGTYVWYFNSSDNYGGTATETITITVTEIPTYLPPAPVNLNSTRGSSWVNYTWEPGAGNVTDSYNVNVNGTWTNGTSNNYINTSIGPHGWSNITVYAYNASGSGTLSLTPVSGETQVLNAAPLQAPIGDKAVTAGDLLTFNIIATDADNDTITYGTNATNGTINATTGEYSWLTNGTDTGTYVWYFNSSDNYGGSATETITIIVTEIPTYLPPAPVNLNSTLSSSWVNYTWEPGAGNVTDSYNVNVNGNWTNGTSNNYINTSIGPHGWSNITVYAYNASGSGTLSLNPVSDETQVLNTAPVQTPIGDKAVTAGMELTFSIISTDADSDPLIYSTNATRGTLNITTGTYSWPTNGTDTGTYVWYFNSSDNYGGSATETITITVTEIPTYLPPAPVNLNSTRGSSWVNYTWEPGAGNVTDSYNVNVNGTWTNGTTSTYNNITVGPHGWSNITVYAYNASGSGTLSLNPVSGETQVLNTAPVQTPIGDKAVTAGSLLTFIVSATDADNDIITYGTNATNGMINATTGAYSWQTNINDAGTYTWNFNSSDNYGGVANETITITVTAALPTNYTPPSPVNLISTQGNFWINHTWEAGVGNDTDSYNVSVNGLWTNGTISNYNNTTVEAHGWSNISVYSYNSSGTGRLNTTALTRNTQVSNNLVTIGNISSSYTVTAGGTISIYPTSSDQDLDTPDFDRNFTNGTFYTNNGTFIWTTASSDAGIHSLQINVTDGYGSVSSANFTITIEIPTYLPPVPVNLISTQGNFWVNHTWESGAGNDTDSYNVSVNGLWANGTTSTYNNTTVAAHGWSNITVYAYNSSGAGTLNTTAVSSNTQVVNNLPDQTTIGNKIVTAGDLLTFIVSATDADNDTITYGTNATKGTLNSTTGTYSWQTDINDVGIYVWYFNSSDNYGGIAPEIITVTVKSIPSYNVSGYVFDNIGARLESVLVQNGSNQSNTSASGYYSINNLSNGTYNFSYSKAGFNTGYLEITISGADNTSANKTLYDTTPPASVNNIMANSTPLYINWTWSDPSNPDFDHVEIYIDSVFKTNVTKGWQFYNASYFAPNLTYTISTRTVDNYSNVNTTWANNTAATPPEFTYIFSFMNDTGIVSNFSNARNASDGAVSVFAEVNASGSYQLNVTTNTTDIPDASMHTLELRYNVSGDNFTVQLWNGSSWNNRTTLNDTSLSYRNITLYPDELISNGTLAGNAGSINKSYSLVRYLDLNASAEQQGMLYLDYQRIYNY